MKILVHGHLRDGQHSLQRAEALAALPSVTMVTSNIEVGGANLLGGLVGRVLNRLRRPLDHADENRKLLELALKHRPDVVLVENSRVLRNATLQKIRDETGALLAYLSPDDIVAPHNLSEWLRRSFRVWDLVFTTKTFNVEELRSRGVRRPVLIGNIFTPQLHRPLSPDEVGPDYEAFDVVFVGQYEKERAATLDLLARAGLSVVVYGPDAGLLAGRWANGRQESIVLRPSVWGAEYVKAMHHGKIAIGFLRKINRDRITQRSVEVPAMGRPMLAEKTEEHDAHFLDGVEYIGFSNEEELVAKATALAADPDLRKSIAEAGRRRCLDSDYDVDALARRLFEIFSAERPADERERGSRKSSLAPS